MFFKGASKGLRNSSVYEHSGKGCKRGLFPGLHKVGKNIKYVRRRFVFYTNKSGAVSGVTIGLTAGFNLYWDLGDGQSSTSQSPSFTYADSSIKKVTVYFDDMTAVTSVSLGGMSVIGIVDCSGFTKCTAFQLYNTPTAQITKIIYPKSQTAIVTSIRNSTTLIGSVLDLSGLKWSSSTCNMDIELSQNIEYVKFSNDIKSGAFSFFYLYNCNLKGTLDLSTFTGMSGDFRLSSNPNLNYVLFPAVSTPSTNFTLLLIDNCGLRDTLDLSSLTKLGGNIQLQANANLTGILFPASSIAVSVFYAYNCKLTGTLDMSGMTGLAGDIQFYGNSLLTAVTFPTSSGVISALGIYSNNLTGTLNLSGLTGLGGFVQFYANSLLTAVTNPTSSQTISSYDCHSCNITGSLDVSGFSNLGTAFRCYSNPLLSAVTLPTNTKTYTIFRAESCAITTINFTASSKLTEVNSCAITLQNNGMTAAQVNQILVDLDSIATNAFTGRTIQIDGTNAAPTGLGLVAKASLVTKGFTVTTN